MEERTREYEVLFHKTPDGKCPVEEFLQSLEIKISAKISAWIDKLEESGPRLVRPYADLVRGKIRELRIGFGSKHYRFLYFFRHKKIIITHGFIKKTDRIPEAEIRRAERYKTDFEK